MLDSKNRGSDQSNIICDKRNCEHLEKLMDIYFSMSHLKRLVVILKSFLCANINHNHISSLKSVQTFREGTYKDIKIQIVRIF